MFENVRISVLKTESGHLEEDDSINKANYNILFLISKFSLYQVHSCCSFEPSRV